MFRRRDNKPEILPTSQPATLLGSVAIDGSSASAVEPVNEFLSANIDLVGQMSQGWRLSGHIIDEFTEDPKNTLLFKRMLTEKKGETSSRKQSRNRNNLHAQDFDLLVSAVVMQAKAKRLGGVLLSSSVTKDTQAACVDKFQNGETLSSVVMGARGKNQAVAAKIARAEGLLLAIPKMFDANATSTKELFTRLTDLEHSFNKVWSATESKQNKFIKNARKYVARNPARAAVFIEAFIASDESEEEEDRVFSTVFSNDDHLHGADSTLSLAVQTIDAARLDGFFAEQYIRERLKENDGDNTLAFMAEQLISNDVIEDFSTYMRQMFESWPSELANDYGDYGNTEIASLIRSVRRVIERHTNKSKLPVNIDVYEDTAERIFTKIHGKTGVKSFKRTPPINPGATKKEKAVDHLQTGKTPKKILSRAILDKGKDMKSEVPSSTQEMLADMLGKGKSKRDTRLIADLEAVVDRILLSPHDIGIDKAKWFKPVIINGNACSIHKANPDKIPRLSVARRSKTARIIFALDGDYVHILEAHSDHDSYRRSKYFKVNR